LTGRGPGGAGAGPAPAPPGLNALIRPRSTMRQAPFLLVPLLLVAPPQAMQARETAMGLTVLQAGADRGDAKARFTLG